MAVGPERVLARRRPGRVGHARLDAEHEGTVRVPAAGDRPLGRGHLLGRAAEVDRAGARDRGVRPGHRRVEGVVDLEHPRAVAEPLQPAPVAHGQAGPRDLQDLARGEVEQRSRGAGGSPPRSRTRRPVTISAPCAAQPRHQRVGERLRAAPHHRPPTECASAASSRPYPAVTGAARSRTEWAAMPGERGARRGLAEQACPAPWREGRPVRRSAPRRAGRAGAGPAARAACRPGGTRRAPSPPRWHASGRRPGRSRAAVASTSRCTSAAGVPSRGCAAGSGGCRTPRRRRADPSARNAGEATASGSAVEQTSWRNPGSVSSSVRIPPPRVPAASTSRTRHPAPASRSAPTSPLGPEPTTTASKWSTCTMVSAAPPACPPASGRAGPEPGIRSTSRCGGSPAPGTRSRRAAQLTAAQRQVGDTDAYADEAGVGVRARRCRIRHGAIAPSAGRSGEEPRHYHTVRVGRGPRVTVAGRETVLSVR